MSDHGIDETAQERREPIQSVGTPQSRVIWSVLLPIMELLATANEERLVKTPFGIHADKMNEFYNGLTAEQKAAFADPVGPYQGEGWANFDPSVLSLEEQQRRELATLFHKQDVDAFERTLNADQLQQWQELQANALTTGNYIPESAMSHVDAKYDHIQALASASVDLSKTMDTGQAEPKAIDHLFDASRNGTMEHKQWSQQFTNDPPTSEFTSIYGDRTARLTDGFSNRSTGMDTYPDSGQSQQLEAVIEAEPVSISPNHKNVFTP